MKIIFLAFLSFAIVSCEDNALSGQLKDLLVAKYKHLFHKLIHKIEKKIKKIEKKKRELEEKRRIVKAKVESKALPFQFPPFPFMRSPFIQNHNNFHFFRPHPRFQIFKKIQSFRDSSNGDGPHGFVNITKSFPGEDGKMNVLHIQREFIP